MKQGEQDVAQQMFNCVKTTTHLRAKLATKK